MPSAKLIGSRRLALVAGLSSLAPLVVVSATAQDAPIATQSYVVQEGDSCAAIAQRFFGDRRRHDIIHAYNPNMGPPPHELVAGTVLILPVRAPAARDVPDARVTRVRRDVRSRRADAVEWRPATRGDALFRGYRVNTLEAASAQLTFQDTSVVEIRANTLVVIYGAHAGAARAATGHAELERGTLRSRLGSLRMRVDTPSATAELDGGSSVVSTDDTGSRVSAHEGRPVRVRSRTPRRAHREIQLDPGFGSVVRPDAAPSAPRPLLPAPEASPGPSRFAAVGSFGGTVIGEFASVPGAVRYHVEILRDGNPPDVVTSVEVPADVTRYELRGLPVGAYRVTVASLDADGLEGRPSSPRVTEVVGITLEPPGGGAPLSPPAGDDVGAELPAALDLPLGTRLAVPSGMTCEGVGPDGSLELTRVGSTTLRCSTDGRDVAPVALTVPIPQVDVRLADGRETLSLEFEEVADVQLELGGFGPLLAHSEALAEGPFTVETADLPRGVVRLRALGVGHGVLSIVTEALDGSRVSLAQFDVEVREPEAATLEPILVVVPPTHGSVADHLPSPLAMGPRALPTRDVVLDVSAGVGAFDGEDVSVGARGSLAFRVHPRAALALGFGLRGPRAETPRGSGEGGVTAGASGLVLAEDGLRLSVGADVFFAAHQRAGLLRGPAIRPDAQLELDLTPALLLRVRAGGVVDARADGLRAATVGALFSARIGERLELGVGLDGSAGRLAGGFAGGLGAGLYADVRLAGPLSLGLFGQFEPFEDRQWFAPLYTAGLSVTLRGDVPESHGR